MKIEMPIMDDSRCEGEKLDCSEAKGCGSRKRVLKKVVKLVRKSVGKPSNQAIHVEPSVKAEEEGIKDEAPVANQVISGVKVIGSDSVKTVQLERNEGCNNEGIENVIANEVDPSGNGKRFIIDLEQPAAEDLEEEISLVSQESGKLTDAVQLPVDCIVKDSVQFCNEKSVATEGRDYKDVETSISLGEDEKEATHDPLSAETTKNEANETNYDEYGDFEDFDDHGEDDFVEENSKERTTQETIALEEERRELVAIAEDRKLKKEFEIFVGGLDRDATEEDVKKVFENVGKVDEVRLHKDHITNKNKGYAFVKFAYKDHVKQALSEMKNPVIHGKRCGIAPSEDNATLFLGNICNTWTKEAIKQKLKDYGVDGVETVTLVPDAQHEGRNRGFAFIEFSCHAEAMLAYKRLQKPDVIFGHAERTAKVAFAEPIREPDPEIMAQVKKVFLDGLLPHWDEDQVKEQLKGNGDIVRVVLARNMSTAKRKDFGFIYFATHEAAVACIERLNAEVGDGNSKTKLRARLSNPLPKTQAVKGGMSGGFRIGYSGTAAYSRFGRGSSRGGNHGSSTSFPRGRGYPRGRGHHSSRYPSSDFAYDDRFMAFQGRHVGGGGRRGKLRGAFHPTVRSVAASGPSRFDTERAWYGGPECVSELHIPSARPPFLPDSGFDRAFLGRHIDDHYYYDDSNRRMKRTLDYADHHVDYVEPNRIRPRLDFFDPGASFHRPHYHDYERGGVLYSRDYYGSEIQYGGYPPFLGGSRPYDRMYYY